MNTGTKFSALECEYTLYFDNRAFRVAEKTMGHSLGTMQDSIGDVTLLLHAGLLRHQPQIKLEKVDEIVDELGYEKIADILGEAMAASPPLRKRTLTKGGILAEALAADARRVKAQKEESLRIEDLRKKLVEEETLRAEILEELQSQT